MQPYQRASEYGGGRDNHTEPGTSNRRGSTDRNQLQKDLAVDVMTKVVYKKLEEHQRSVKGTAALSTTEQEELQGLAAEIVDTVVNCLQPSACKCKCKKLGPGCR